MLNGGDHRFHDLIASSIGWWIEAGLDASVEEAPRDWLTPPPARPAPSPAEPARPAGATAPASTPSPAAALPNDLAVLQGLLASGDYVPGAPPVRMRVTPSGDPAAGLMIVTDMPELGDSEAGRLFAGDTARLFDAMLAAIGRTRESVYLAPLSPARLTGGRFDPAAGEALAALMRRHIALAAPKALILFGEEPARLLIGDGTRRAGGLASVKHDGGTMGAITVVHPRLLRQYPARKAGVWADMRLLSGVLAR